MRNNNYGSWVVATVLTALFYIAIIWMIAVALTGCTSTVKERVRTVEVKIPVYVTPPQIEVPEEPTWETVEFDPEFWQRYLQAMTRDLLKAWQYIEELKWAIEVHNEAGRRVEGE